MRMNLRKGFSLIELLVVIAVIAILAGIAFPVFARAKDSAYRSSDMSKLNEISTALHLYRTDQGAYPPALLGYATGYYGGDTDRPGDPQPAVNNIVPADQALSPLYPKRVQGLVTFQPSYNRPTSATFNREFSTAVWPSSNSLFNGGARNVQRYGPERLADRCAAVNNEPTVVPRYFYRLSGFDAALVQDGFGDKRNELRYSLFFTAFTVPADACTPVSGETGSAADDPRQLGYSDPPDTTVVTWDSFFREYSSTGAVQGGKRDLVLFLGGSARAMDSAAVASQAWKVQP